MMARAFYCNDCESAGNICFGPRIGFRRDYQSIIVDAKRKGVNCWIVAQVLSGHEPWGFMPDDETIKFLRSKNLID